MSLNKNRDEKTTVPVPIAPPVMFENYDDLTLVNLAESEIKKQNYIVAREIIEEISARRHSGKKENF